jgi:hypothetical protein
LDLPSRDCEIDPLAGRVSSYVDNAAFVPNQDRNGIVDLLSLLLRRLPCRIADTASIDGNFGSRGPRRGCRGPDMIEVGFCVKGAGDQRKWRFEVEGSGVC